MDYKLFVEFYEKNGKCINDVSKPKNPHSQLKLEQKFQKYLHQKERALEKKKLQIEKQIEKNRNMEIKIDEDWIEARQIVFDRDNGKCQLIQTLENLGLQDMLMELKANAGGFIHIIDPAHIYARSVCPKLKYDPDNVVCLNRFSHSQIDMMRDPITGDSSLTNEEMMGFFEMMIGEKRMNILKAKKNAMQHR